MNERRKQRRDEPATPPLQHTAHMPPARPYIGGAAPLLRQSCLSTQ